MTQINASFPGGLTFMSMRPLSTFGRERAWQLTERAEQLEQLAAFMSRPDGRTHAIERAAEYRARAALIQAGCGISGEHGRAVVGIALA